MMTDDVEVVDEVDLASRISRAKSERAAHFDAMEPKRPARRRIKNSPSVRAQRVLDVALRLYQADDAPNISTIAHEAGLPFVQANECINELKGMGVWIFRSPPPVVAAPESTPEPAQPIDAPAVDDVIVQAQTVGYDAAVWADVFAILHAFDKLPEYARRSLAAYLCRKGAD